MNVTYCTVTVVDFAPGYMYMSECNSARSSDDRSGGAMYEEDVETAKSEFRLGMPCIVHRGFKYK